MSSAQPNERSFSAARGPATSALLAVMMLSGCGPKASLSVMQEGQPPPLDHFALRSKWAYFDAGAHDRYLVSFPLPGAVAGDRHFFLYLVCTPGLGEKLIRTSLAGEPNAAVGFFIQQRSMNAGLTDIVDGRVEIKSVPLRNDRRRVRVAVTCHDGSSLIGEAVAKESLLDVRAFEEETHVADVEKLMDRALQRPASAPASE